METARPANVPADRVVNFDIYDVPGSADDVHLAYRYFQQNHADIFWTPHNGGHWVATRAEDIEWMIKDHTRFSMQRITLPPMPPESPRQIPLELDPPEHTGFRRPLVRALTPRIVDALDGKIRSTMVQLIEGFLDRGECEFIAEFAKVLPIVVFLDLVDLPRADRDKLLPITEDSVRGTTVEVRAASQRALGEYLQPWIVARREKPGVDLLSTLVNTEIDGVKISFADAMSFASLVLFGGLDTVASMMGFFTRFLATHPQHVHDLVARLNDVDFLRGAVEELLRRHGLANTARVIVEDFDHKGLSFRAGQMILPINMLVGLDERRVEDPMSVDFDRPAPIVMGTFGAGLHICPGAVLARRELLIFLQEWLARIPSFHITAGTKPILATGMVNGVLELHLSWP